MRANTAELKNNLSKYLRQIRETRETLVVCDRGRPVATLRAYQDRAAEKREAEAEHRILTERAHSLGMRLSLPKRQKPMREISVEPVTARDGRTDIATIDWVRGGRGY